MHKSIILAAILSLLLASCQQVDESEFTNTGGGSSTTNVQTKNVKFKVNGLAVDYSTSSDFSDDSLYIYNKVTDAEQLAKMNLQSKATLSDAGMTDLYVFDTDGTLLVHQLSTDSDFGTPNIKMTYGRHELAFVATKGTVSSYTGGQIVMSKVKDTFAKYVTLDVSSTTLQQSVTLDRAICGLRLTSEGTTSESISSVKVTVGSYYGGLKVPSLTGVMTANKELSVTVPSGYFLSASTITSYLLCPTIGTAFTSDISIDFLDGSGTVLYHHSVTGVELKSNQVTNIHGNFFGGQTQNALSVNLDWDEQKDVEL